MGIGAMIERGNLLLGIAFVNLAGFAVWYVGALFASLWFRRNGFYISSGLFFGFLILSWFVSLFGNEIWLRLTHSGIWTAKTYFEVLVLGPVLVAAWILTGLLLFRPALVRRPIPD
jgi:hypothetical protein